MLRLGGGKGFTVSTGCHLYGFAGYDSALYGLVQHSGMPVVALTGFLRSYLTTSSSQQQDSPPSPKDGRPAQYKKMLRRGREGGRERQREREGGRGRGKGRERERKRHRERAIES